MKRTAITFTLLIVSYYVLISLYSTDHTKTLFRLKNGGKYPAWEEMLTQDKINLHELELAYNNYSKNNFVDDETKRHFKKILKKFKKQANSNGEYISQKLRFDKLTTRRNPNFKKNIKHNKLSTYFPNKLVKEVPNKNSLGNWMNIGPFGNPTIRWSATGNGAIQHLEIHPSKPEIMYACSRNGGLWKTLNSGKTWIPQTDYFPTNNTSCLEINQTKPNILYLGTAQDEVIWISTDGGKTWLNKSSGIEGHIFDIHSAPKDPNRIIVATSKGIFLSTDQGNNWVKKISGKFTEVTLDEEWNLIIASKDNDNIKPELYFSTTKGNSFKTQKITTKYTKVDKFYLAIHSSKFKKIKVFALGLKHNHKPTRFLGIWTSEFKANPKDKKSYFDFELTKHPSYNYTSGITPLIKNNSKLGFYELKEDSYGGIIPYTTSSWVGGFFVSPNNPNHILTMREKFWGSSDGGIVWEKKASYGNSNWADNRFITMNKKKDSVFWCNDGGIWAIKESDLFPNNTIVNNSGLTKEQYINSKVVSKNGNICVSESSQMDISLLNKNTFISGGQDIGQIFVRNQKSTHVASADVYRGRIKPEDDTKFITGGLKVKLNNNKDTYNVYDNMEGDHFNPQRLYGFTNKNLTTGKNSVKLVRSRANVDGWLVHGFKGENIPNSRGHSWVPIHDNWEEVSLNSTNITKLNPGTFEQSRSEPNLAFLGDENNQTLYCTENLNSSTPIWRKLNNAPKSNKYRIATHQYNSNMIVLATNHGVYISKDRGKNWTKKGNFPGEGIINCLLDKNRSEGVYVSTNLTVYYIDENLEDWIEFNRGLPLHNITEMRMAYYPKKDNRLYVSKYGRGVWSTNLMSSIDKNKPKADFGIYGKKKQVIKKGDSIKLVNLSQNYTNSEWILTNGSNIIKRHENNTTHIKLNQSGYYSIKLIVSNKYGKDLIEKNHYIFVQGETPPFCYPKDNSNLPWYKHYKTVKINNDTYNVDSPRKYYTSSKTFHVKSESNVTVYLNDTHKLYSKFYTKIWIDWNNDGKLENNEEVVNSKGQKDSFHANFKVPRSVIKGKPLLMRITGIDHNSPPKFCEDSSILHQTIDFRIIVNENLKLESLHYSVSSDQANFHYKIKNASEVISCGILYSTVNGNLNVFNSKTKNIPFNIKTQSYKTTISNLSFNSSYYYRPYAITLNGIVYGKINKLKLKPYNIPLSLAKIATQNTSKTWNLKAIIYPENNKIQSLSIQYGTEKFTNEEQFSTIKLPKDKTFPISKSINVDPSKKYKFRVKLKANDRYYFSNIYHFNPNKTLCTPKVLSPVWYKTIKSVKFNNQLNNSNSNNGYENFKSTVFKTTPGKTYELEVTDSYPGFNMNYSVYIDFNNDGDFDDYHELVAKGTPNKDTFKTIISIPQEDIRYNKNLTMRIIASSSIINSTCLIPNGQIEDYSIFIKNTTLSTSIPQKSTKIFEVYPNPVVNNTLSIKLNQVNYKEFNLKIFDPKGGEVIKSAKLKLINDHKLTNPTFKINISTLKPGIYFVRLSNKAKESVVKIIKK